MEKKKTCINCGSILEKDAQVCKECGTIVEEDTIKVTYEPDRNKTVLEEATERLNNRNEKTNISSYVITSLITFVLCMVVMYFYCNNYATKNVVNTTKLQKDVTVTDEGIADAVDKIYDAVVVVENYVKGSLYSTGTGFVYKTDNTKAYILTNQHVVENASTVRVVLTDDKTLDATIVGGDAYSDIAVLSVEKDDIIATATIGSSDELRVGDTTFAVGAPLDSSVYSWTVTRGILSGKNRLIEVSIKNYYSSDYVMEVLQTDAAINSGNSGGPLCNSNGEVIGITNMKIASSNVEGMGFAIPIETAIKYADIYISGKTLTRPYLGISMSDYFSKGVEGVYLQAVETNSPANAAGLKKGDIITQVNGKKVSNSAYLKYELYKHEVGDTVTITYVRDNKEHTTKVELKTAI